MPPIYFGIKRRDRRMLDEIVLDLAPLEGKLRSLGAEARRLLRTTPPARDEEPLDSQALLLEEGF